MREKVEYMNPAAYQELLSTAKTVANYPMAFLKAAEKFTSDFKADKNKRKIEGAQEYSQLVNNILVYSNTGNYDDEQYSKIAAKIKITKADEKMWADIVASNPDNPDLSSFLKKIYLFKTNKVLTGGEYKPPLNLKEQQQPKELINQLENFAQGAQITFNLFRLLDDGDNFEEFYNKEGMGKNLKSILETIFTEENKSIIKDDPPLLSKCAKALNQLESMNAPCVNNTLASAVNLDAKDLVITTAIYKAKVMDVIRSRQGLFNSSKNESTLETALENIRAAKSVEEVQGEITKACENYQPRFPWFDAVMEFVFGKCETGFESDINAIEAPASFK